MLDPNNLNEIFATDQQMKTRSKKNAENPQKLIEKQKEQEKTQKKLSKLSQLEEDDYREEDGDDSDYEGDAEESNKKDKKNKTKKKKKNILFGKINLSKYFDYDPDNIIYDFPNYNNIIVKPKISRPNYKICNICFNFANYTCKHCGDKYCSIDCYKKHKEVKCSKFLDV